MQKRYLILGFLNLLLNCGKTGNESSSILIASMNCSLDQPCFFFIAINSRDWKTARVHASLRARDGTVTSDFENMALFVKTHRISARRLNLSFPPQRKTESVVSSGLLLMLAIFISEGVEARRGAGAEL
jgi:hypothetical protein